MTMKFHVKCIVFQVYCKKSENNFTDAKTQKSDHKA